MTMCMPVLFASARLYKTQTLVNWGLSGKHQAGCPEAAPYERDRETGVGAGAPTAQ